MSPPTEKKPAPSGHAAGGGLRTVLAVSIIGMMAVVFAVSFAAIIYRGPMSGHLGRGISLALAGAAIMAVVGAFRLTYRGTIVQPQDVTAIILAIAVASIAGAWIGTADALFATVAVLVAATTAFTGLVAFVTGLVRLGFVVRFIPYPVLGGFLAATGLLMLLGAVGMTLGEGIDLWNLATVLDPGKVARWLPWVAFGAGLVVVSRRFGQGLAVPLSIVLAVLAFYVILLAGGGDIESAKAAGLLLGPFDASAEGRGLGPWILVEADWLAVLRHLPTVAVVAGMALVGCLLNASALEVAAGRRIDPDRDLRGVGLSNILAAAAGGMVGYHLLSQTLFARFLGVDGRLAGLSVAAFTIVAAVFGTRFLEVLPIGIFAGTIAFLGVDLLYTWLWIERRRLPARDFAVVLLILGIAAAVGFLQAIAIGLLVTSVMFVIEYARMDVVLARTTVAHLRSRVERPAHELRRLEAEGRKAVVYRLGGFIFFGTASRLLDEIEGTVADAAQRPRIILLDFKRVNGLDASAIYAISRLRETCRAAGVTIIVCGLSARLRPPLARAGLTGDEPDLITTDTLDRALRLVEERLLAGGDAGEGDGIRDGLISRLARTRPGFDPADWFETRSVTRDAVVFEQGGESADFILLLHGTLRAEFVDDAGRVRPVATIKAGAFVGEIGFYAGVPRTARVLADEDSRYLRIDAAMLARLGDREPGLLADFHRLAAALLAQRLGRTNALVREAEV